MGMISYYFVRRSNTTRMLLKLLPLAYLSLGIIAALALGVLGIVARSVGLRRQSQKLLSRGVAMLQEIDVRIRKIDSG